MSDGVRALFSAIRQQQSPIQETNSQTVPDGVDIADGYEPVRVDGETKGENVIADNYDESKQTVKTTNNSREHGGEEQKNGNFLDVKTRSEKKRSKRVVSESSLQTKVCYFVYAYYRN